MDAQNRSALIRVPAARGNSTRAEFRSPDPMCNPYLTFACMLAAGLDGVKNKIMPPESTNTNIYHLSAKERKKMKIDMLPGSLAESQEYLMKDKVLCDALGSHIVETLAHIAEAETDAFRLAVPPVGAGQVPCNLLIPQKFFNFSCRQCSDF